MSRMGRGGRRKKLVQRRVGKSKRERGVKEIE